MMGDSKRQENGRKRRRRDIQRNGRQEVGVDDSRKQMGTDLSDDSRGELTEYAVDRKGEKQSQRYGYDSSAAVEGKDHTESCKAGKTDSRIMINEIDEKIAALEAKMASAHTATDSSLESDIDVPECDSGGESSDSELEPIPALPSHALPRPGVSHKATVPQTRAEDAVLDKAFASNVQEDREAHFCELCKQTSYGSKYWKKHKQSLLHLQNVVLSAGAAYEPAQHRSCYCKACDTSFKTPEALFDHRETKAHEKNVSRYRKASYCKVCMKQFNSPPQLHEHVKGKGHIEKLETIRQKRKLQ